MQEVVTLAKQHHKRIAPEIKQTPVSRSQVAAFARVLTNADIQSSTVVQSSSARELKLYRSVEAVAKLGYLNRGAKTGVAAIRATGASYDIVPYAHVSKARVRSLQQAGLRVWVYTITNSTNDRAAKRLLPDGIITNSVVLTRSGLP